MNAAAQQVRSERVSGLLARLKAGDLEATRYESTPDLRARRVAEILSRSLSRGQLRRRLKRLELPCGWEHAQLEAVSAEGKGLRLRRSGEGLWRSGPAVHTALLRAFPELLQHVLTNLTVQVSAAPGDAILTVTAPATSGSNAMSLEMDLYAIEALGTAAEARYNVTAGSTGMPPASIGVVTTTDPYGSGTTGPGLYVNTPLTFAWSAAGLNWLEINAGQGDRSPGNKAVSFSIVSGSTWTVQADFQWVTVTYTIPPCDTCRLDVQVHDACDGSGIGGALVDLGNGLTCTTAGGGGCSIEDIPDGTYTVTVTKTGYETETRSFTCACGGGTTTLSFDLTPDGGCDTCDLTLRLVDWCTGGPLSGVEIWVDGVLECTTGADGVCTITGLENGDHTIVVSKPGYGSQTFTWRCNNG